MPTDYWWIRPEIAIKFIRCTPIVVEYNKLPWNHQLLPLSKPQHKFYWKKSYYFAASDFFLFNLIHKTDESLIAIFCSSQYLFRWIDDCVSMISCCWAQMRHSCTAEMIPFSSCLYSEWYSGMSVSIHCLLYVRRHHIYSFIANYKLQFYIYYYECRRYVI